MPLSAAPRRPRCGIWATGLSGCTSLTVVAPGTSRPSTLEASHRGSRRSSGEDQNDLPGSPPWAEDHVVARVLTRPRKEPSTGRLGTAATTGTSARTSSATTSCSSSRGSGGISALLFYGWLTGSRGRALLLLGGGNKWRLLSATEGLAPLTAAELQKTARGMSGSAGPDGWSAAEPASLPHFVSDAFGSLAQNRPLPSRLD